MHQLPSPRSSSPHQEFGCGHRQGPGWRARKGRPDGGGGGDDDGVVVVVVFREWSDMICAWGQDAGIGRCDGARTCEMHGLFVCLVGV